MSNKNLNLRKLILSACVVLLALIYIVQLVSGSRSSVKDFVIDKTFDTIEISSSENGAVNLKRYGDFWKVNDEEADSAKAKTISDAARSLHTLSAVSKSASDDTLERYGLTDGQKITVKVSDNGKEYLSFEVGKDAAGGQQNYIRVNGKSEIYLASGALRQRFSVKADELKKPKEETKAEEAVPENASDDSSSLTSSL
ncbi:MAG: DUF4340 domain-containing protein [Treponema sp.]|nr:DUF4340 domain-containing protein [Treponema sp.]